MLNADWLALLLKQVIEIIQNISFPVRKNITVEAYNEFVITYVTTETDLGE